MSRRGRRTGVLGVAVALLCLAAPSAAVDSTDITGDITPPELRSLTLAPTTVDVTHGPATMHVTARVTDDLSGLQGHPSVYWEVPGSGGYSVMLHRTSGDELDGTYAGSITIPQYFRPGHFPIGFSASDRVGNHMRGTSEDLRAKGFPHAFDITDANPDATAPTITHIAFGKSVVNVVDGPSTIRVDISAADQQSGVKWISFGFRATNGSAGGTYPPFPGRISGDAASGTWSATATIPRYAPQGRWRLTLHATDEIGNHIYLEGDDLTARGLASSFEVVSDEDARSPELLSYSMTPIEVNVRDQDQPVTLRMRLTDDKSGIGVLPWSRGFDPQNNVQVELRDPVFGQGTGTGYMRRVSGDAMDGVYEKTVTIPKSSATGLRPARAYVEDEVGNYGYFHQQEILGAGGVPVLLVYNVPLPPLPLGADPLDGGAVVRWDPPTDDRGAEITEYVVQESPQGLVAKVGGDARAATMSGLTNGIRHTFEIKAVNKAGPSDPSAPVATTPAAGTPRTSGLSSRSGYWMVGRSGSVYAFGDARWSGNAPVGSAAAVDIEPTPARDGYWVLDDTGRVSSFGAAQWRGNAGGLDAGERVTSMSATRSGAGYWLFTTRGRVLAFGDAPFLGDMSKVLLNGPVLDSVPSPSGKGYYMVAADGGVFSFGDARFAGSMGGVPLNAPVQSLVPDPDGSGYWLVAADGGIFAFGASFHGSMGSSPLNRPVTGMVGSSTGRGYLMVAEDGGIFAFGDVAFRGSLGSSPPAVPIVAVAAAG